MKRFLFTLITGLCFLVSNAQILSSWNVRQQVGYGFDPMSATTNDASVSTGGLNKAQGVTADGIAADRGWGGTGFNYSTSLDAINNNAFITIPLLVRDGYIVSLSSINPFDYRRDATGPTNALVQYKIGTTGAYNNITTVSLSSSATNGASAGPISLAGIFSLQNLPRGTVVTFRIVPYGATAANGAFYIYDRGDNDDADFAIVGGIADVDKLFYTKSTGNLNVLSTWGTNIDGTGTQPTSFNTDNTVFKIRNRATATIDDNWTIGGANTLLAIGDSINTTDFFPTLNTVFTLGAGASLIINPNSVLSSPLGSNIVLANRPVTIKSTAEGSGSFGTILGALGGGNNITVERFIPSNGRKSYTMVSSPVSSPTIYESWQENGINIPGFGTIITGSTASGNGFDAVSFSGLPSIFTYNDAMPTGSKWRGLTGTSLQNVNIGVGFLLYVRGDRTVKPTSTGVNGNAVLRATGIVVTGDTALSGLTPGAGKFSLIANPYASAINWMSKADGIARDIVLTDLDDIFYVYDPSLGVFASYNGVTNTLSPSNSKQPMEFIQSGQAFFVKANGANPSILFKQKAKTVTVSAASNTVFGTTQARPQINLNVYKAADNDFADGVVALFDNNFKAGIAKEDAVKFDNFNENISLIRNGEKLAIEGRPLVKAADTLFVGLNNFSKTAYKLVIDAVNLKNVTAVLVDKYAGTTQLLNAEGSTSYNFTVNGDAASAANDRFMVTFGNTTSGNIADAIDSNNELYVKLSPNPVINQLMVRFKTATAENTTIKLVNSLGKTVRTVNAGKVSQGNITISTNSLSAGLYTVQLVSGSKVTIQKIVKD